MLFRVMVEIDVAWSRYPHHWTVQVGQPFSSIEMGPSVLISFWYNADYLIVMCLTVLYSCDPSSLHRPGEASDNCIARKNYSSTIFSNPAWNTTAATSGYEQCGYGFCSCCPKTPGGPIAAECPPIYHEALHGSAQPFHKLDCGHCERMTILGNRSWPGFQQNASFGRDGSVGLCVDRLVSHFDSLECSHHCCFIIH